MSKASLNPPSTMNIDEDERIAVRALDAMRNAKQQHPHKTGSTSTSHTPALSLSTTHTGSSPPHTPPADDDEDDDENESGEMPAATSSYSSLARMQSLPLVSGALRVYEAGKANSRVVQYTSSLVSSSLRHASSRLPAGSGERMDEFAGGMLDRLDRYRRTPAPAAPPEGIDYAPYDERGMYARPRDREDMYLPETDNGSRSSGKRKWEEGTEESVPTWLEGALFFFSVKRDAHLCQPRRRLSLPPPPPPPERAKRRGEQENPAGEERQVAQRSRWQAMLLEAGGLSAALSDESMRKLRYCLQWLQYATQHIDAQILILRDFIASLQPAPSPTTPPSSASSSSTITTTPELTPAHLKTLAHLRSDIVHTIRQVVGVVSKYTGGALPEPARGRVRGFILDLPKKFGEGTMGDHGDVNGSASASGVGTPSVTGTGTAARRGARRERGTGTGGDPSSPVGSQPNSPHIHLRPLNPSAGSPYPTHSRRGSLAGSGPVEAGRAMAAAQRVLTLATESLDMMRGVTAVVGESLDRADAWVDRLRTVGIQRGMDGLALPGPAGPMSPGEQSHSPREQWRSGSGVSTGTGTGTPSSSRFGSGSGAASPGFTGGAPSPGGLAATGMRAMSLVDREQDIEEDEDAEGEEEHEQEQQHVPSSRRTHMEVDA
ncbi:Opi1-domain-containing protein [Mycena amicta]|nr:Opi1-domain-containing protein [Mycena amicta]